MHIQNEFKIVKEIEELKVIIKFIKVKQTQLTRNRVEIFIMTQCMSYLKNFKKAKLKASLRTRSSLKVPVKYAEHLQQYQLQFCLFVKAYFFVDNNGHLSNISDKPRRTHLSKIYFLNNQK